VLTVIATSPTPLGVAGASDATALFILLTIGASRVAGPAASGALRRALRYQPLPYPKRGTASMSHG
jgi:hypothetical protein